LVVPLTEAAMAAHAVLAAVPSSSLDEDPPNSRNLALSPSGFQDHPTKRSDLRERPHWARNRGVHLPLGPVRSHCLLQDLAREWHASDQTRNMPSASVGPAWPGRISSAVGFPTWQC